MERANLFLFLSPHGASSSEPFDNEEESSKHKRKPNCSKDLPLKTG